MAWCAFLLRRAVEKLRADMVGHLTLVTRSATPSTKEYSEWIQDLLKEIIALQKGAFAPYLQNSVLHSLLVLLGGFGGVQLPDLLAKLT